MASTERTLKSMLAAGFVRSVSRTAADLRRIADDIERAAGRIDRVPSVGNTSAAALASNIVHTVMWGLANASVDNIVSAAAEYDTHSRQDGFDG